MTKTNAYECGKKWPRGKNENKSKIYAEKPKKTIILDKRTAKTKLMKNNITKKHKYRYCSSHLLTIVDAYSLIIDSMTELNTSNACPFSASLTTVHGDT